MSLTKVEEGIAGMSAILETELGEIDRSIAKEELVSIMEPDRVAFEFVHDEARRSPKMPGFYDVLGATDSPERFRQVNAYLAGRVVLVPSADRFLPAVISIEGRTAAVAADTVKFQYINQPYSVSGLTQDQRIVTSFTAQAETKSVGSHEQTKNPLAESEHIITVANAVLTPDSLNEWKNSSQHPNHIWKKAGKSVLAEVSSGPVNLLGDAQISRPYYLSPRNWPFGVGFKLYWHEEMLEGDYKIAAGDQDDAMEAAKSLGFLTLEKTRSIDTFIEQLVA